MQEPSNTPVQSGIKNKLRPDEIFNVFPLRRKRMLYSESEEKVSVIETPIKDFDKDIRFNSENTGAPELVFDSPNSKDSFAINAIDFLFLKHNKNSRFKFKKIFSREQVSQSKMVCNSCKSKLLKPSSQDILVEFKMFNQPFPQSALKSTFLNSNVYTNLNEVKEYVLKSKSLEAMRMQDVEIHSQVVESKLTKFKTLNLLLLKFFMNEKIEFKEIEALSKVEHKLFLLLVNKKKFEKTKKVDVEFAGKLSFNWNPKRFEENLRFILNKAFKFLTSMFNVRLFYNLEKLMNESFRSMQWKTRFTYGFYGYYFQEIANFQNKPLESFFHPKASKYSQNLNKDILPKTISQYYLNLLCTSKLFRRDLTIYIEKCLLREVKHNIVFKVNKMCLNWEKEYYKKGETLLIERVSRQFKFNPKCKIPWGLNEVSIASNDILKIVNSQINEL